VSPPPGPSSLRGLGMSPPGVSTSPPGVEDRKENDPEYTGGADAGAPSSLPPPAVDDPLSTPEPEVRISRPPNMVKQKFFPDKFRPAGSGAVSRLFLHSYNN